jgi:hypothetical protein
MYLQRAALGYVLANERITQIDRLQVLVEDIFAFFGQF